MFKLFSNKISKKQLEKSINDFKELWNTDPDTIWAITDKDKFMTAMNSLLCRKCNYGKVIEKLSDAEMTFYFNIQFDSEVNNGGFSQFFYNSSGDFTNETAGALSKIGAAEMRKIYDKALSAIGRKLPKSQIKRDKYLDKILTDDINKVLEQCDDEFYKNSANLTELNYQFVLKNKEQFT